jgi:hypothetical protein
VLKPAAQPAKFSWPATGVGPRCDVGTKVNEGAHPQDENQVWAVRTPSRRCETSHSGGEAEQQERRRCWHIGYAACLSGVRTSTPPRIRVQCDLSGRQCGPRTGYRCLALCWCWFQQYSWLPFRLFRTEYGGF